MRSELALISVLVGLVAVPTDAAGSLPGRNGAISFLKETGPGSCDTTVAYSVRASGNGFRQLTSSSVASDRPTWAPDGRQMLFVQGERPCSGDFERSPPNLVMAEPDGSGATVVRESPMGRRPTWGPRDQVLWQISYLGGPVTVGTIGDEDGPSLAQGDYPSWSPDGNFVLLTKPKGADGGCCYSLAIYDVRTGVRVRRLVAGKAPQAADWSPDGKRIVFARTRNGRREIWVMRKDGSKKRFLRAYGRNPIWSPDGRLIAYIRDRHGPPADLYSDLYVMHADGSSPRRIARDVEYIAWQALPR